MKMKIIKNVEKFVAKMRKEQVWHFQIQVRRSLCLIMGDR